ncbi:MAG TPA: hypothetical protein GXZ60_10455 [Intrasporangiaceae bacterium]|nr:hypothetical protein [Intrasporangiaceae bacterium]
MKPAAAVTNYVLAVVLASVAVFTLIGTDNEAARGIHLMVMPHPDDELQGWATLTNDPTVYTVFLTMTNGEATVRCAPDAAARALRTDLGERAIRTEGLESNSPACRDIRLESWNAFLDEAATTAVSARLGAEVAEHAWTISGRPARAWIGDGGARIALDLGDGALTSTMVVSATKEVLQQRGEALPDLPLDFMTSAAYYNDADGPSATGSPAAYPYAHPDHLAVTEAAFTLAPLARGGAWIVTHPFDPRATHVLRMDRERYDSLMALGTGPDDVWQGWRRPTAGLLLRPGDPPPDTLPTYPYSSVPPREGPGLGGMHRVGAFQQVYGWLAFPNPWTPGEYSLARSDALFARSVFYIHTDGTTAEPEKR